MTPHVDLMSEAEAAVSRLPQIEDTESGLGALRTDRGNLPLESIRLRAALTGLAARLELTQGFRNPFDEPLEATFIFPLPDRAAVTALRMEADGRTVEGVLAERGEAREQYDRAISEGRRASIAEEERAGVFTMRVGNIMPAERVQVRLVLAAQLPYEDGEATFRFPLVVAPRYIPGAPLPGEQVGSGVATDTDATPDASRISPPVLLPGFPNPIDLSVEVEVDPAGLRLTTVRSSLHVVTVDNAEDGVDGRFRVRLAPGERANRDFVLRFGLATAAEVGTSLAVLPDSDADAGGTFALTVLPPASAAPLRPRDVVLVLDRSGSMAGWKMVAARRAAARIVDTLSREDRFAVLAFDTLIEAPPTLATGLVEASDRHRFRAVEYLARLEARGGTEMLAPLLQATDLLGTAAGEPARDRVLVLVTDGQVGNEDQILRQLAPRLAGAQIYPVGVDTAVNAAFLRRLAQLGRGRCELVESEDRLDEAMTNIHRRIGAPVITQLDLAPDGLRISPETFAPGPVPDLFAGAPLVVTGRFAGPATGGITVRGRTAAGEGWNVTVPAEVSKNPALAALWARARIRDLEDRYVVGSAGAGEPLEREIVELSLRHSVLCRFTAFVAQDTRVVNEGGTVHRVTQPVDAPQGWDMLAQPSVPVGIAMMSAAPGAGMHPAAARAAFGPVRERLTRAAPAHSHPTPTETHTAPPGTLAVPAEVRAVAAEELRRLEEASAHTRSAADRGRLMADLADRLRAALARLERAGAEPAGLIRLRRLVEELTAPCADDVELDRRLAHAHAELAELAGGDRGIEPPSDRSSSFWRLNR